jgi:hypothetical protein
MGNLYEKNIPKLSFYLSQNKPLLQLRSNNLNSVQENNPCRFSEMYKKLVVKK